MKFLQIYFRCYDSDKLIGWANLKVIPRIGETISIWGNKDIFGTVVEVYHSICDKSDDQEITVFIKKDETL